jgi:iron(III) transport system permease protein
MIFGTILGAAVARGRSRIPKLIEAMVQIPYSIPGIVLSLCMIMFWMQPLPGVFPRFYGTYKILLIVYITRFFVVQSKASYAALASFDHNLWDSARVSGASILACWKRIVLPIAWPEILSGATMVFIGIFTELTLSSLLWSVGSETIGSVILDLEQSGATQYSSALSTVVCVIVTALFLISKLPSSGRLQGKRFHVSDGNGFPKG